ncbi:unnamed protein product [Linum tenue]|uniref:RNase H type-1 domain-containing protein n=1 Tax=Linum tenue TaxID=586396 RepID=A0AAV0JNN2_9ROSI|nr:unnamed protein product [Linum tenue]
MASTGNAAAGGLLRDHLGRCSDAFVANLGSCSITRAELRGALEGLRIAWRRGFKKIQLNLDSSTAINIIKNWADNDHNHGLIAQQIGELLSRRWEVNVCHIYREANFAADFLASKGHCVNFGTHLFDVCDPELRHWLLYDVRETAQERGILI